MKYQGPRLLFQTNKHGATSSHSGRASIFLSGILDETLRTSAESTKAVGALRSHHGLWVDDPLVISHLNESAAAAASWRQQ